MNHFKNAPSEIKDIQIFFKTLERFSKIVNVVDEIPKEGRINKSPFSK